ncbi:MAG TPA: pitrilysin family protein [Methylomirabilota bacterium]|jgi:zinc protease|nr:pitrilysin family protein [Methylomirabilota bacterium]
MRRWLAGVLLLAMLGIVLPVRAAETDRSTAAVVAATLDNGLRVLLLEDHRSPIVTVQTWYRVGSRNEARGATGIAHFLEHLMFRGTAAHGPGVFARTVERNGGQDNAFTSQDVTSYYVDIAADRLDLVLELEADRMHNLVLDPKIITSEREVVIEERRTRTEDDPGGALGEEVSATAFRAHPYGQPIIGWMIDIRRITPEEIRAFYRTYYAPGNALLVVAGDFKAQAVLSKIRAVYGAIPRSSPPPPVLAVEPAQNGERRVSVQRPAELPIVYLGYPVPNQTSPDAPALEVLSVVLSGGRASRLYRHLVHERQLALEAGGDYSYFSIDPNLFWFWATPLPGQTADTLEKELLGEMEQLRKDPVGDVELKRAKNQIEASFVFQDDSIHRRASLLARFELVGGYAMKDGYLDRIRAVTAADLQRVARTYFQDERKNVGILLPKP